VEIEEKEGKANWGRLDRVRDIKLRNAGCLHRLFEKGRLHEKQEEEQRVT